MTKKSAQVLQQQGPQGHQMSQSEVTFPDHFLMFVFHAQSTYTSKMDLNFKLDTRLSTHDHKTEQQGQNFPQFTCTATVQEPLMFLFEKTNI